MTEIPQSSFRIFADGLDHPEGVAFGPDGLIYAGGEAGQIYRIQTDGTVETIASTGGFILGICLDADCNVYACDIKHKALYRVDPDGEITVYSDGTPARRMITPNFPVFDSQGNLFLADSGGWHANNGCIYRIQPGGATEIASDQFSQFPNGLSISPDGREMYVALSNVPSVSKAAILPTGQLGAPQLVVPMPKTIPDGLAFDCEGNLLIACYTPHVIYRYTPNGELTVFAEDWESTMLSAPTNVAYFGDELKSLVVANLGRWHLASTEVTVGGCALNYPSLPRA